MKPTRLFLFFLPLLATSCGGGGGGDPSAGLPLNDEELQTTPSDPTEPTQAPTAGNNSQLGELSELIGNVSITYSFDGNNTLFALMLEYTPDNFGENDSGTDFLTGSAQSSASPPSTTDFILGQIANFTCSYFEPVDRFTCIFDVSGVDETFFLFRRLDNGFGIGQFEFCNGASTNDCATNLQSSPDGGAFIDVEGSIAIASIASRASFVEDDLNPYLQYLKQGSPDYGGVSASPNTHSDDVIVTIANLKNAITAQ